MKYIYWASKIGTQVNKPHTFTVLIRNIMFLLTVVFMALTAFFIAAVGLPSLKIDQSHAIAATCITALASFVLYLVTIGMSEFINLDKVVSPKKQEKLGNSLRKFEERLNKKANKAATKHQFRVSKKTITKQAKVAKKAAANKPSRKFKLKFKRKNS